MQEVLHEESRFTDSQIMARSKRAEGGEVVPAFPVRRA
jgi:hypothetical protein